MNPSGQEFDGAEALLEECDWLRRLARSLVTDVQRAEDAVQETLAAAIRRAPDEGSPNRSWLSRVLRNALAQDARGQVRRKDREALAETRCESPASDEIAQRMELQRKVFECVNALDPIYRDVIVLRYFDALPPREIATKLDRPVKTVHTRIQRGLELLRARLDADFEGGRTAWFAALLPFALGEAAPLSPLPETTVMLSMTKFAILTALSLGFATWGYSSWKATPSEQAPLLMESPAQVPMSEDEPKPTDLEDVISDPLEEFDSDLADEPLSTPVATGVREPARTDSVSVLGRIIDEAMVGVSTQLWAMMITQEQQVSGKQKFVFRATDSLLVVARANSDRNGDFEFENLNPGSYWIGSAPTDDFGSLASLAQVGGAPPRLTLRAYGSERISGRVILPSMHGVQEMPGELNGAVVRVSRQDVLGDMQTECDSEGLFETEFLAPGEYRVEVRSYSAHGFYGARTARAGDRDVVVEARVGLSITGVVRDPVTGEPSKANVALVTENGSISQEYGGERLGKFEFDGLAARNYSLIASSRDGRVALMTNIELREGEPLHDLELFLEESARFALQLKGPRDSCRVAIYWSGMLVNDFTLRKDKTQDVYLPPGPALFETYYSLDGQRILLGESAVTGVAGTGELLELTVDR